MTWHGGESGPGGLAGRGPWAVVGFPELAPEDRRRIEEFRRVHDPLAASIAPHVTLVFPVEIDGADLWREVLGVSEGTQPVEFTLGRAVARADALASGSHVFLLAEGGRVELLGLHDRLYGGLLRPHLRTDIPFEPHLTVAARADFAECERLAEALADGLGPVRGRLRALTLVDARPGRVRRATSVQLGGR